MSRRISEVLEVTTEQLEAEGAFDGFVDVDSRLYVDPHLLPKSKAPELSQSYERFQSYFKEVVRLLLTSKREGDALFREAWKRLQFPESAFTSLGYSAGHTSGSGIGPKLAWSLASTGKEIVDAGRTDPVIFELVGLLERNVGADRISDMTILIILPDLLRFTERVAKSLGIKTKETQESGSTYQLPHDPEEDAPILLIPLDVLRTLLVADDWNEIDIVCAQNEKARQQVNDTIGDTWKEATQEVKKEDLKRTLTAVPEALDDLLRQYKDKPARPYNFAKDPEGITVWHSLAKSLAEEYPLSFDIKEIKPENILQVVTTICEHFAKLIEDNGLSVMFYDDNLNLRNERYAQLLFFGVADAYCRANDLDLNREPNAGRGPVDFKVSRGYDARVNVEIKYTSNTGLRKGYTTQLPIYNAAEKTHHSIYLVIITTQTSKQLEDIEEMYQTAKNEGKRAPELIVIDGRVYPSASKVNPSKPA